MRNFPLAAALFPSSSLSHPPTFELLQRQCCHLATFTPLWITIWKKKYLSVAKHRPRLERLRSAYTCWEDAWKSCSAMPQVGAAYVEVTYFHVFFISQLIRCFTHPGFVNKLRYLILWFLSLNIRKYSLHPLINFSCIAPVLCWNFMCNHSATRWQHHEDSC
jgi:hypothetical protein